MRNAAPSPRASRGLDVHGLSRFQAGALLLVLVAAAATACGKDETPPESIPFKPLTARPAPKPVEVEDDSAGGDGDGTDDGSGDGGGESAAAPSPQPGGAPAPAPGPRPSGVSIDNCCGALNVQARIEKDASQAARYRQAAGACYSISKMVKTGRTTRASALRQVRALAGSKIPGNCY